MPEANLQFFETLNDFLPAQRQHTRFSHRFEGAPSVKDMVEALGVPHTEVALIIVNGNPVSFQYHVCPGDSISVYSTCDVDGISAELCLTPPLPDEVRFVVDVHLGRLAAYLRMLGFDTLYPSDYRDEELARISSVEKRVLLTRDLGLLKRSIVVYGCFVRETNPWRQLAEVLQRYRLLDSVVLFHRCTQCNSVLSNVDKTAVVDRIPPETRQYYDHYRVCPACGKLYWRGSHFDRMDAFLADLRQKSS